ncbi:MAG: prepilin-type N-terminal cleavage/methylation domain-containing protein [Gemmatimonadota bacterium]|nr:prepilin-type N-terminal cleavage/methylation domain-containing protein [Gemmatimonadota bacterium]
MTRRPRESAPDRTPCCEESGVLHARPRVPCASRTGGGAVGERSGTGGPTRGATLVELLISLSILTIGVLAAATVISTGRRQAESAARRGAEALAARQVLEHLLVESPGSTAEAGEVDIGGRRVRVVVDTMPDAGGLRRLRARARMGEAATDWPVEVLVPSP